MPLPAATAVSCRAGVEPNVSVMSCIGTEYALPVMDSRCVEAPSWKRDLEKSPRSRASHCAAVVLVLVTSSG